MRAMTTLTLESLEALLSELGLQVPIPAFPDGDVLGCPLDIFHSYLANTLSSLVDTEASIAWQAIQSSPDITNGDLIVVLPRLRLKDTKVNELSFDLVKKFPTSPLFAHPFADGAFLRVFFSSKSLPRPLLPYIQDRNATFGFDTADGCGKKVLVEFSSPNIGTDFQPAHLRSTLLGAAIASAYEASGWDVIRLNYLGDWGKHVGLLAAGLRRSGTNNEQLTKDPLGYLRSVYASAEALFRPEQEELKRVRDAGGDVASLEAQGIYAERDAFFADLEDGDEGARAVCLAFRERSIARYKPLYARLGISFAAYDGESLVSANTIAEVESLLKEKGVYQGAPDGGWQIDFDAVDTAGAKKLGTVITRFRTGTTSYLLRDIAAVLERERMYRPDKIVYVVTADQNTHFAQIFRALEIMGKGELRAKLEHVDFGKVAGLTAGEGSEGLLLEDILTHVCTAAETAMEAFPDDFAAFGAADEITTSKLAASALLVQELAVKRGGVVHFDIEAIVSPEADNGAALQRCYVDLHNRIRNASSGSGAKDGGHGIDYSSVEGEESADLLRLLAQFPGVVKIATAGMDFAGVVAYMLRVVEQIEAVLDDNDEDGEHGGKGIPAARLMLLECTLQVLGNGLRILGLTPMTS